MDVVTIIQYDPHAIEAYGALREGVHVAGYTFERACGKLEWLLDQDRWRGVGDGFHDINDFLASIKLESFRPLAEQRKRIAQRIKELQPKASNRQIAKVLGVNRSTVDRDTGAIAPVSAKKLNQINADKMQSGANAPPVLGGAAAAKAVESSATKEQRKLAKQEARIQREAELGAKQVALPDKKYGVIYADPEWRFEVWSRETGLNAAADNHYPTSPIEVIKARDVPSIAADDCVLFLWATVPMLPQALEVMAAWGFLYVTNFAWAKDKAGTGYWNRNQHELLLVGRKGNIPVPAPGTQWPSVINAPIRQHSRKPDEAYELIETYFPTLPKIELNCRGAARSGWDAWGNEVEAAK